MKCVHENLGFVFFFFVGGGLQNLGVFLLSRWGNFGLPVDPVDIVMNGQWRTSRPRRGGTTLGGPRGPEGVLKT